MTSSSPVRPRIVVGVDGSPQSESALRWAAHLAERDNATIEVVTAWEFPPSFGWVTLPTDLSLQHDLNKITVDTVHAVFGETPPEGLKLTTVEADPSRAILDAAQGAYLVVVGSRGHGGFTGLLLGSVSRKVAEHATCPVLVVHDQAPIAT